MRLEIVPPIALPKQNLSAKVWMTELKHEDIFLSLDRFITACAAPLWIDAELVGRYGYPGRGNLGGGNIEYEMVYEPFRSHGVKSRRFEDAMDASVRL